ncbi:hypothetical protein H4Q26_015773 [Puccinia striiformis f. sp. tritici PST-130]|nr:hypothetical protein H4Q26_015773 [Puccinia striiformis f. sp. tritici PST-130]
MENNRKITESDLKLLRKLSTETGGFSDPKSLYDRLKKQNDRPSKELLKILDPSTCHRKYIWSFVLGVSSTNNKEIDVKKEEEGEHRDERQVELDINRSFVYYPKNISDKVKIKLRQKLQKLIVNDSRLYDVGSNANNGISTIHTNPDQENEPNDRHSDFTNLEYPSIQSLMDPNTDFTRHQRPRTSIPNLRFLVCYPPIMIVYLTCVLCLTKSIQIDNLLKESKKEGSEIDLDVVHLIMASLPVLKMDHNQSEEQEAVSIEDIITSTINLYTKYPPTDPKLKLNKIMGPKSCIYTWNSPSLDDTQAHLILDLPIHNIVLPVPKHKHTSKLLLTPLKKLKLSNLFRKFSFFKKNNHILLLVSTSFLIGIIAIKYSNYLVVTPDNNHIMDHQQQQPSAKKLADCPGNFLIWRSSSSTEDPPNKKFNPISIEDISSNLPPILFKALADLYYAHLVFKALAILFDIHHLDTPKNIQDLLHRSKSNLDSSWNKLKQKFIDSNERFYKHTKTNDPESLKLISFQVPFMDIKEAQSKSEKIQELAFVEAQRRFSLPKYRPTHGSACIFSEPPAASSSPVTHQDQQLIREAESVKLAQERSSIESIRLDQQSDNVQQSRLESSTIDGLNLSKTRLNHQNLCHPSPSNRSRTRYPRLPYHHSFVFELGFRSRSIGFKSIPSSSTSISRIPSGDLQNGLVPAQSSAQLQLQQQQYQQQVELQRQQQKLQTQIQRQKFTSLYLQQQKQNQEQQEMKDRYQIQQQCGSESMLMENLHEDLVSPILRSQTEQ